MLDSIRLRGELTHIHRTLSAVAAGPRGRHLVDELRRDLSDTTTAALVWQSLFADCLRVVYGAAAADGSIGDDEIEALYELVFTIARHYAGVLPEIYGDFAVVDGESTRAFLERYADDPGPFGRGAATRWPGFALCRRAAELGESEALERYERMMLWLISAACQIGGVTEGDPRWRGRVDELDELRRTLVNDAGPIHPAADLRIEAFLSGAGAFAAVQQAASVFDADPFDVEAIHAEARGTFEQMVERATDPEAHLGRGRMLLVLGDSGAGKTHLLRGFRRHVHEYGRGFVAYAQLHTSSQDYARYLLQHVVDSLARPYAGPSGERTGLYELASGLLRIAPPALREELERLADDDWDASHSLRDQIEHLLDGLLRQRELASFDPDLVRVMLYALYPDPSTTSRVYKYLRCDRMNEYDRRCIGDVTPRDADGEAEKMIRALARIASVTQQRTLVLMIDQAELAGYDAASSAAFRRAIDTLSGIVSQEPSIIAVVACLTDLYEQVRNQLTKFAIDRLERDPEIERLQTHRSYPEIEAIVGHRLSWLFAQAGAVYRPETPVYPIPEARLRALVNWRTRDILDWCQRYQAQCSAAGKVLDSDDDDVIDRHPPPRSTEELDLDRIAAAWNDAVHASNIEVPDEDEQLLGMLATAAKACAAESELTLVAPPLRNGVLRLQLAGPAERAELAIAVTNRSYQRGAFTGQIEYLRRRAGKTAIPVAVRTHEFPRGPACDKALGQLRKDGGRPALLDDSTLRALVVHERFQPDFPEERVVAWRRRDRPISGLPGMAEIFDLERLRSARPAAPASTDAAVPDAGAAERGPAAVPAPGAAATASAASAQPAPPPTQPPRSGGRRATPPTGSATGSAALEQASPAAQPNGKRASGKFPRATTAKPAAAEPAADTAPAPAQPPPPQQPPPAPAKLAIGKSTGFQEEPREIELASLLRHTGILGSSGSGKTTLALNLIEQVLERDIAVVLVDRKGDLAGYAKPDWWQHTANPARARRLAERIDVRLFTPGTRGGRPLGLSVIPDLTNVPELERDRMVQYAAHALAAMMRLGDAAGDSARRAILTQAIAVMSERKRPGGLPELIQLLAERDDVLIARAGRYYSDRLFDRLVQDLETVRLSDADLFDAAAEPLTAETLLGRGPDGKVPLAIASTRFLGDLERIQSWTAHLIACLSRHVVKHPRAELHTLFMIDEADLFMPAGASKPPSKEPLQDLLKRARAAGLGVVLASQSPADFDYRSREQINTWFLGRIADRRSIDKMKPLFEHRPLVRGKLGNLELGRFVLLQEGAVSDLERTPSLLRTEQLSESELLALAAATRPRR